MSKFKIEFNGELQDDVFRTEVEAEEFARYLCACSHEGAEILHMSNPGEYYYEEELFENPEYRIVELN